MNYIKRLEQENRELRELLARLGARVIELQVYYSAPKFQGIDNDYAHVSTDVLPKLVELRGLIAEAPADAMRLGPRTGFGGDVAAEIRRADRDRLSIHAN